jgi:carbonic anhydrase/acetyltransferase-like protein (isoleucine patch superfamily)
MLIKHAGTAPRVDPTAYVAQNAVVRGGLERSEATMEKITRQLSEALGSHFFDEQDV